MSEANLNNAPVSLSKRRRRRAVIGAMLTLALLGWMGVFVKQSIEQHQAVRLIRSQGGTVIFDTGLEGGVFATVTGVSYDKKNLHLFVDAWQLTANPSMLAPITDKDLARVEAAMESLPELRLLNVAESAITDRGVKHLLNLKIKSLLLGSTAITDVGAKDLAQIEMLSNLNLSGTGVTDEGLRHLASLPRLRDLSLEHTEITDQGLRYLHDMKQLEALYIRHTNVTAQGIAELKQALPHLSIAHSLEYEPQRGPI